MKITNQTLNNILKMILMLSKTVSFNSKCIKLKNKRTLKKIVCISQIIGVNDEFL